MIVLGERERIG